jgi:hypothetical protein
LFHLLRIESSMPTIVRDGPYSFVCFSSDRSEPPHIHVVRDRAIAKFWLGEIKLAKNRGFATHELNQIERLVKKHKQTLLEGWHDYFGA